MKAILLIPLLITLVSTIQSNEEIFWKDENLGVYVFDHIIPEHFEIFRNQFKNVAKEFLGYTDAYTNFATFNGYQTKYIPRKYKTKYLLNVTERIRRIYTDIKNLTLLSIKDRITDRSDFNPVISHCFTKRAGIAAIIFLNKNWLKNEYGDIAIYNDDDEIVKSFHPRMGRVILMKCGTKYKVNPPALWDTQELKVRYLEYTSGPPRKISTPEEDITLENIIKGNVPEMKLKDDISPEMKLEEEISNLDISKHITRRIETDSKKLIYIFDNLVPAPMFRSLHRWFETHSEYYDSGIEVNRTLQYRGTNRLTDIYFDDFRKSTVWSLVKKVTMFVNGGIPTYHHYDYFGNHGRRMTHTFFHTDSITDDKEYSSVFYLTPNWNPNMYGETIFLENNNLVTAVVPKYGRLVVFDGSIEHTSRTPSPSFNGARFSFVVKTSNDTESAQIKVERSDNCCPPWDPPIYGDF